MTNVDQLDPTESDRIRPESSASTATTNPDPEGDNAESPPDLPPDEPGVEGGHERGSDPGSDDHRPDYVGDGYDPEPLLTAEDVADLLKVPKKSVYNLEIPRVRISKRRVRWRPADVRDFIDRRVTQP